MQKNTLKKLLAFLLVPIAIISMIGFTSFADSSDPALGDSFADADVSTQCLTFTSLSGGYKVSLNTSYQNKAPDTLEIPAIYKGKPVTAIGSFASCTTLCRVIIPNSITQIDAQAFNGCSSLNTVIFCGNEAEWNGMSRGTSWDGGRTYTFQYHQILSATLTTPPTHTQNGVMTHICNLCGATYTTLTDKLPGHTFGDWEPFSDTQHVKHCACNESEYAPHGWNAGEVTTPPTYDAEGVMTYTCSDCGATKTEPIDRLEPPAFLYGDADGNGTVNLNDAVLIRNYLAHYDYDTGSSTVTVSDGADADGNGTVNLNDAVLLNNYLADYNYDTGESGVVLGPKN